MLPKDSRLLNVMNIAVEKSGWKNRLPKGRGRGLAISYGYESFCAQVAEVSVDRKSVV